MAEENDNNTPCYPNKMGRVFLLALQDTLPRDDYSDLLKSAAVQHFAQTLPANNWAKEFEFDYVSRLNRGLLEQYGPRGGRRMALRAGQRYFESGWGEFGTLAGLSDVALKARSLPDKLKTGLLSIARLMTDVTDQNSWIEEHAGQFEYHVGLCPVCWNRSADEPICFHTIGFLQAALHWFSTGLDFRVRQTFCTAMGDEYCVFRIDKDPLK